MTTTTTMSKPDPAQAAAVTSTTGHAPTRDADLLNAGEALRRAASRARALAQSTGTPCYVWKDGKVVNIGAPALMQRE
ncbi:MAG: hypothetical protein RLY71_3482 [Pseudomonadota bacterium]|jgi:hypothetical protein